MITAEFECSVCGVKIVLDDTILSKNGKKIPIDSRTGKPHPRHVSLGAMFRNRQKILFKDAFPKLCYICKEYYSVINKDCPVCFDLTVPGLPEFRPGVVDPVYGVDALIKWAKSKNKKIPLYLIMRDRKSNRKENARKKQSFHKKGWQTV
jgi:hypothetical protein